MRDEQARHEGGIMNDSDVTGEVAFDDSDGELLPITHCVCGAAFAPWNLIISIYREDAARCPRCGRKLYFRNEIRVYEVRRDANAKGEQ